MDQLRLFLSGKVLKDLNDFRRWLHIYTLSVPFGSEHLTLKCVSNCTVLIYKNSLILNMLTETLLKIPSSVIG
jgi:hypothetical protein